MDDEMRWLERSEREGFLQSSVRIGYDDLFALRHARTYRFTEVEPKPEYL